MSTTLEKIRQHLRDHGVPYEEKIHPPTPTSEESASARGESLAIGAKALLMKADKRFVLLVMSAALRLDSKAAKRALGAKKLRFATGDELHALTGLPKGAVPPFGRPIFDLDLVCDRSLQDQPRLAFNAGSLTNSLLIHPEDYARAATPEWADFSVAA